MRWFRLIFWEGASMGVFEQTSKHAIESILKAGCSEGKFGYFLSEEKLAELVEQLYLFMVMSRKLKSTGDRFLRSAVDRQG
jgi:hypothetical protein